MKTEELIASLAADARAIVPLPSLEDRIGRWLGIALPVSVILALVFGVRHDLGAVAATPDFVFSGVFGLLVMIAAGVAALALSVPGAARPIVVATSFGLLFGWIALFVAIAFSAGATFAGIVHEPWHWACIGRVALLSLVPSLSLMLIVRRGFVLEPGRSAFLSFVAGGALAAGALQFVCPVDRAPHILVSHLLPVLLLAACAAIVQFVGSSQK